MFDKSIQGAQKVQELIKAASKDGVDKQVIAGKLQRIDEKVRELKDQLVKDNQAHEKIVKTKEKQIRKGRERERFLEEKIELGKLKSKKSEGVRRGKQEFHAAGYENRSLEITQKQALQRQIRKRKEAQQQLKESRKQLGQLQQKMIQNQRENERLRQQIQLQWLLIQELRNQKSEVSSQQQNCMDFESEGSEVQITQNQSRMMDMSEGRVHPYQQEELQPRKMSQDQQTDDQQQQQESDQFYSKMISKVSQTESVELPSSMKQINSIESQSELHQNKNSSNVRVEQFGGPEGVSENGQESGEKQHEGKMEASVEQQKGSKKGWFSWQNWFGKSKK